MKKSKATEALRVASEVAAIKTALKKHGYTIRKQSRQAAWTIQDLRTNTVYCRGEGSFAPTHSGSMGNLRKSYIFTPDDSYKLTYQPAPISAWILHPQSDNPNRQTLLNIIHSTLVLQPVGK